MVTLMCATDYLNYENDKFSKSRGVGVFGTDAMSTGIDADIYRFYLLLVRPENQDASFSWNDLVLQNNMQLVDNVSHLIHLAVDLLDKHFAGIVPAMRLLDEDIQLLSAVNRGIANYLQHMEEVRLKEGLRDVLAASRLANQIQSFQPGHWSTAPKRKRSGLQP
ncbi:methionine--tRNA ligase, cytoplasmic-like [Paramacrobiotus metropolitanus]|uniref:methionine--tRNA ligase, cytoplasmic-like n=1 Tax=Paramacrobiotus metropolitanus TaxID=2943436 RepID=UPI002445D27E|nr:methionine--tRNA ligase, cytoplasmic-like [Paramacrobiotus metropolitanus]XP_055334200.1 methionine--tRNA ligase, cytoplasmic-like [Paramacrobiotus metropolitanus]XP_055334201.1 methionine--tRNA ligase, cytoplasmic-like [Paramacrobiotus metropolitanus]